MPPAQQSGNQNQTLLELIYAMKSLAQQVEFYHQDISRRLDEEVRARRSDLVRMLDLSSTNLQALSTLPVTMSDRVEKLLSRVETEMESKIGDVKAAIEEVRRALQEYTRTVDRATSHNEITPVPVAESTKNDRGDITGKIEVTESGDVRVSLNSRVLRKLWYVVVVVATGGGTYWFVELIRRIVAELNN